MFTVQKFRLSSMAWIVTAAAVAVSISACKRPAESGDSNLQTLDNFSGRNGGWQPNSCGTPALLDSHSWQNQQGALAQQLNQVRQAIEKKDANGDSCIVLGEDADESMRADATYTMMAASPGVVIGFCQVIGGKIKISSALAEQACGDDSLDNQFLREGQNLPDYRACLTMDEGKPVLAVQNSIKAIRHTLIRSMSYLYSGAAKQANPVEWAYMEELKNTFMDEISQKYPEAHARWSAAEADDLTRFVYSEAIDQVQCDSATNQGFAHYPATKAVFFDSNVAKQKLEARGVQVPSTFRAFAARDDLGSRVYLPWYEVVPDTPKG